MYPPLLQWLPGDDNAWFRVVLTNLLLVVGDMEGMWLASLETDDGLGYAKVSRLTALSEESGEYPPTRGLTLTPLN